MSGETNGLLVPDEIVMNKIFHIRNQKVMLDIDLAMFQLTKKEWREVITICDNLPQTAKYSPASPFAFTESGVECCLAY